MQSLIPEIKIQPVNFNQKEFALSVKTQLIYDE
jgi:hypothetical protein